MQREPRNLLQEECNPSSVLMYRCAAMRAACTARCPRSMSAPMRSSSSAGQSGGTGGSAAALGGPCSPAPAGNAGTVDAWSTFGLGGHVCRRSPIVRRGFDGLLAINPDGGLRAVLCESIRTCQRTRHSGSRCRALAAGGSCRSLPPHRAPVGRPGRAPRGATSPRGRKEPTGGLSQQSAEAGGSLTREASGRAGAASTTTGRAGTVRRLGPGKQDGKG